MINILLTGASGFFGKTISSTLASNGYRIFGLPNAIGQHRIDISKPFALNLNQLTQIVIHAAGKAHSVPKTNRDKQAFYEVNYEGTKNLCHALEGLDRLPRSFIFISSVAVYGLDGGQNINENNSLKGTTPYAESKIMAESWLAEWAVKNSIKLSIVRLPLIAGPNPPGNLGAMIDGIKSGKYLSIGQADARKSVVWAEDIARIIPSLAEKGGIYNLTDGYHPTFGELEESISNALGKRKPIKVPYWLAKGLAKTGDIIGRFPINSEKLQKITSTLTFDDSKARKALDWNPTPVLSKIAEMV
ncbi:NAD-dependent epimerase/dehydratase family protein [Parapedobacter sp. ISTM3]|uniref:NAD-dependent epimerase/dehydratase family protein n=1 Tax=Parapedobacter sp. ISTM3 TaxID=2800130 RepID=UPI0019084CBC|nr:NAD-dependent epimerase/dehydratase family protein [Parapedobacter sp. ISTM3]MBK1438354.1 NAD-dependent epimerase/dehydratase family protein [Parapedobacter sp. ISTM3]